MALNYRLSPSDSLGLGTGVMVMAPLHGDLTQSVSDDRNSRNASQTRYQASSPFIEWRRGYRAWDTMMLTSMRYSQATDSDSTELMKLFGNASLFQQFVKDIEMSRWTVGTNALLLKSFYSGNITDPFLQKAGIARPDQVIALMPFLQYTLNDRYSLRTEFGYFSFVKFLDTESYVQDDPFQSLGMGISITRDIFLFPNIQFAAKDIRSDRTSIALSANINLF